jgi:hypothetical protein
LTIKTNISLEPELVSVITKLSLSLPGLSCPPKGDLSLLESDPEHSGNDKKNEGRNVKV